MTGQPTPALAALSPALDEVPGSVSVWCGRPGAPPAYTRHPHETHYAASTMKIAVMVAAYRLAAQGRLDLDAEVLVHDEFASAAGPGATYRATADYDSDPQVWERCGRTASLRWLVRRMIVRSSNLATNLVLERTGFEAVAAVWAAAGAHRSVVTRGIQDEPAAAAGCTNLVTAADLARLLEAIAAGADDLARADGSASGDGSARAGGPVVAGSSAIASRAACTEMLEVLLAQEMTDDVVRGLPARTRVAHKNGWVEGVRHSAALVLPDDAPPYTLVTCVTGPLPAEAGCALVARVAAASWADRHLLEP